MKKSRDKSLLGIVSTSLQQLNIPNHIAFNRRNDVGEEKKLISWA